MSGMKAVSMMSMPRLLLAYPAPVSCGVIGTFELLDRVSCTLEDNGSDGTRHCEAAGAEVEACCELCVRSAGMLQSRIPCYSTRKQRSRRVQYRTAQMAQQKALFLTSKQGSFEVRTTPVYKPGPDQLLIKIEAAALNPVDWRVQAWGILIEKFPAILGEDTDGEVFLPAPRMHPSARGNGPASSSMLLHLPS